MTGYTVFSNNQGAGYIHNNQEDIMLELNKIPVTIGGITIQPGDETTLLDHLSRPLRYLGLLGENEMIFFIGKRGNLFESEYYYQSVHRISDTRIFEIFNMLGGRDFNFVNGKWK